MEWLRLAIELVLAVAGLGSLTAFFMVRAQKRKLLSEAGKTDAEAQTHLSDAHFKRVQSDIALIEPYEKMQARMQHDLDEAFDRIDALEEQNEELRELVMLLLGTMRDQGMEITAHKIPPRIKFTKKSS